MVSPTQQLAAFVAGLTFEQIPEKTRNMVKTCALDTIGCAIAGSDAPETLALISGLYEDGEEKKGQGFVWAKGFSTTKRRAALINGAMAHAVEMDDLHKASKTHPGAVIVPTVFTMGAPAKITGRQAILAMATGYETMIRLGEAVGTVSHRKRGWHATATCGTFGAAAAYSKILGTDEWTLRNAFGLAGTQAAGLFTFLNDGSLCKRFQVGKAAENGCLAIDLATAGLTGPTVILEAEESGYLKAVSDQYYFDKLLEGLGTQWKTEENGLKFYSCCGHTHQAIFAAISLKKEHHLDPLQIERVIVETYGVSGQNWGVRKVPENSVEGQFNFPYVVAVGLMDGQVARPQFAPEKLRDPVINALAERVDVRVSEELTARYPQEWCSTVTIRMKDGREFRREVVGAKGDPQNPLTTEEVVEKFNILTQSYISAEKQRRICDALLHLEDCADIDAIQRMIVL